MKKNMSSFDRTFRIILSVVFFILALTGAVTGFLATLLVVLGIFFLLTAIFRVCVIYKIFGLSTIPKEKQTS